MASNNHGGKRPGAGRKPSDSTKRPICVKLSPDVLEYLATVDNKSAAIEQAVRKTPGYKDWSKFYPESS